MCTVGNLWISGTSLGLLEIPQCSSVLPNIKKKLCSIIFESIVLVIYLYFKIYFLIGHHCKIQSEFSDLLEKSRSVCSSYTMHELRFSVLQKTDQHTSLVYVIGARDVPNKFIGFCPKLMGWVPTSGKSWICHCWLMTHSHRLGPGPGLAQGPNRKYSQWQIQDFPEEGAPTPQGAPTYDFAKFS